MFKSKSLQDLHQPYISTYDIIYKGTRINAFTHLKQFLIFDLSNLWQMPRKHFLLSNDKTSTCSSNTKLLFLKFQSKLHHNCIAVYTIMIFTNHKRSIFLHMNIKFKNLRNVSFYIKTCWCWHSVIQRLVLCGTVE